MLLFFCSMFSSGSDLVQWSKTILAILVKGHKKNISVKSGHWPKRRCCFKIFLFLALMAILCSGLGLVKARP